LVFLFFLKKEKIKWGEKRKKILSRCLLFWATLSGRNLPDNFKLVSKTKLLLYKFPLTAGVFTQFCRDEVEVKCTEVLA